MLKNLFKKEDKKKKAEELLDDIINYTVLVDDAYVRGDKIAIEYLSKRVNDLKKELLELF